MKRARGLSLLTRVFLANGTVLLLIALLLLFSPVEIDFPVTSTQAAIIVSGFVVAVAANLLLLRPVIAPLRRLEDTMRAVEPHEPGRRVSIPHADADVTALTEAFNDMLDRLENERRESGRRALAAEEEVRRRIARELHDEVGQVLTAVMLGLEDPEARESVRRSLDDVRRIAGELRPQTLDELGLQSALRSLCTTLGAAPRLRVERRLELGDAKLTPEVELAVYRVAQESLTNVMRHADATAVLLSLQRVDGALRLVVRDDGRSIDGERDAGAGLAGMQERALHIGGRLTVHGAPGGGTEVVLDVPVPERTE
jgi:two-component system, NarL family, sensor histidine kinase UhpB